MNAEPRLNFGNDPTPLESGAGLEIDLWGLYRIEMRTQPGPLIRFLQELIPKPVLEPAGGAFPGQSVNRGGLADQILRSEEDRSRW